MHDVYTCCSCRRISLDAVDRGHDVFLNDQTSQDRLLDAELDATLPTTPQPLNQAVRDGLPERPRLPPPPTQPAINEAYIRAHTEIAGKEGHLYLVPEKVVVNHFVSCDDLNALATDGYFDQFDLC